MRLVSFVDYYTGKFYWVITMYVLMIEGEDLARIIMVNDAVISGEEPLE